MDVFLQHDVCFRWHSLADEDSDIITRICFGCQLEANAAKMTKYHAELYCGPCFYILNKFLRVNVLPDCKRRSNPVLGSCSVSIIILYGNLYLYICVYDNHI